MGFFGRILCAVEREGKVTDFPHIGFQVPSVWGMLGKLKKKKDRALKRHDSSHSGWRGRIHRQIAVPSVK